MGMIYELRLAQDVSYDKSNVSATRSVMISLRLVSIINKGKTGEGRSYRSQIMVQWDELIM